MIVFSLQIHITERCGYSCRHCYIDENAADMDDKTLSTLISQIKQHKDNKSLSVSNIAITGGDPLCHPKWQEYIKAFTDIGIKTIVLGTPKTLTLENLTKLRNLGVNSVQVSLDGLESTHDFIRGKGCFQETIECLRRLNNSGFLPRVMFTVNDINRSDMLPLIDFLDGLDIRLSFSFDFCSVIGNAKENGLSFSSENLYGFIDSYCRKKEELLNGYHKTKLILADKSHYIAAHQCQWEFPGIFDDYSVVGGCSAGWCSMCVLSNGDIYPCRRLPQKIGNIHEDDLLDVIENNSFMRQLRNSKSYGLCAECKNYKICRGCPAVDFSKKQSISKVFCPFFKRNSFPVKDKSFTENEMLKNTFRNIRYRTALESFYSDKTFIRACMLLDIPKNRFAFLHSPNDWCIAENIPLSNEEIKKLLLYFSL